MPFVTFIAAASLACFNPAHRDGESVRCGDRAAVMRLYGIKAPPPITSCNSNFNCADDPGTLARDHLAELTRGQEIICTDVEPAKRNKKAPARTVRCTIHQIDLSCAMVADGFAEKIDKALDCPAPPPVTRGKALLADGARSFIDLPPLWRWVPLYLMAINIITYFAFAADKSRATRALNRISEVHLLTLTVFGGGIGALIAQQRLDHMRDQLPFANRFAILLGLQIGTLVGIAGLLL
jgi:uncharacterized membrane protein YsdA (DUF1294 family)/endonuclease YncB( thermonuclease family)